MPIRLMQTPTPYRVAGYAFFTAAISQLRTLALPIEVVRWSLTTMREKLVKIGAEVVSYGRHVTFQLTEVGVPKNLFREFLWRIDELRPRPAPV